MGNVLSRQGLRNSLRHIPLRMVLVMPFVLQVTTAVGVTGWLSIRHGQQAVNQVASELRTAITHHIDHKLNVYLATTHRVNQLNYDAIQLGQLDPNDSEALFRHFMQQSESFPEVDSVFFGHSNGEFVGHNQVLGAGGHQLMRGGPGVGGYMQFFEVDQRGQPQRLIQQTPAWVTTTRPWYHAAVQAQQPVWGEIFPYHAYPVLALPTSRPVYDAEGRLLGVLGNNFFLSQISDFLAEMEISEHGQAFILDRDGLIVASSTLPLPFEVVEGKTRRLYSVISDDPLIRASSQMLLRQYGGYFDQIKAPRQFEFRLDRERQFMQVAPFGQDQGLNWLIVVVMPEQDFMASINLNRRYTIGLCMLSLAAALGSGLLTSRWITRSIHGVSRAAEALAQGHFHQSLPASRLEEIERLGQVFNTMATQLESSFNHLQTSKEDLEAANAEIQQQSALFRLMAENMTDLISLHSPEGQYQYVSPSVEWLLGYQPENLLGEHPCSLVHPADAKDCNPGDHPSILAGESIKATYRMRHKLGHYVWIETITRPILNDAGVVVQLQTASRDVTETMRMRKQLQHDAFHDSLTGLPNRKLLQDRLEVALHRTCRHRHYHFAVLFLDVDRFKVVNDSLGHLIGDELLIEIASRLRTVVRPTDLAARLGGDEFIVLLEDVADLAEVITLTEYILTALRRPLQLSSQEVFATVSVGIVMGDNTYQESSELLRDADIAMYRAKGKGRDGYEVFNTGMHEQAIARLQLETELRRALLEHPEEFVLYYQPIIDIPTANVKGFEALVRWQHPQRGLVPPGEFIPVAEETGLITPLSYHLMTTACNQLKTWQVTYPRAADLTISVNLAAVQLHSPNLIPQIDAILSQTGLSPRHLVLEITESMLIDDIETTLAALHALRQRAIAISVDDFGTGYSSLSYLYQFPLNHLKIDRSFVSQMQTSPHHHKIVETIVTLAHQLGLKAIAEGIETQEQLSTLRRLSCDQGQGYWFGRPQPPSAIEAWLHQAIGQYCLWPVA
jgi:diguanylate cyclase (GGDEF)-like protein/PAS domain S-box-containing protein